MMLIGRDQPPISPHLVVSDAAAAIDYYQAAFGAVERRRLPGADGGIVLAELAINGALVVLSDESTGTAACAAPKPGEGAAVSIRLALAEAGDVDIWFARAVANGGKPEMAPIDAFWGLRFAALRDPFGHRWVLLGRLDRE